LNGTSNNQLEAPAVLDFDETNLARILPNCGRLPKDQVYIFGGDVSTTFNQPSNQLWVLVSNHSCQGSIFFDSSNLLVVPIEKCVQSPWTFYIPEYTTPSLLNLSMEPSSIELTTNSFLHSKNSSLNFSCSNLTCKGLTIKNIQNVVIEGNITIQLDETSSTIQSALYIETPILRFELKQPTSILLETQVCIRYLKKISSGGQVIAQALWQNDAIIFNFEFPRLGVAQAGIFDISCSFITLNATLTDPPTTIPPVRNRKKSDENPIGIIVGSTLGVFFLTLLALFLVFSLWTFKKRTKPSKQQIDQPAIKSLFLEPSSIVLHERIGTGHFSVVYRGNLK
jgi:hypothetical protein